MIFVCVICTAKRPPLMPLETAQRQLLEAVLAPVISTTDLKSCILLQCNDCKALLQSIYNFQQTALVGVIRLKFLIQKLNKPQTVVKAEPLAVTIKIEPELEAPKQEFVAVSDINPLTEEYQVKEEPIDLPDCQPEPDTLPECRPEPVYDSESTVSCDSPKPEDLQDDLKYVVPIESKFQNWNLKATVSQAKGREELPGDEGQTVATSSSQFKKPSQPAKPTKTEGSFEVFTHQPKRTKPKQTAGPYLTSIRWKNGVKEGSMIKVYKRKHCVCPHCGKTIINNDSLQRHIAVMHGELAPCKCEVCGRQYRNQEALKVHKKQHVKKFRTIDDLRPELYCRECQVQYQSPAAYRLHRTSLKHMSRDQYAFQCEVCKKKFPSAKRLQAHMDAVHLDQKKNKCDKCDKSYIRPSGLRRHIKYAHDKASKLPTHICHLCGKTFTIKKSLVEHLYTHEGVRPHQCPRCPATFVYKAALFTHNRLKHLKIKGKWKKKKKVGARKKDKEEEKVENEAENTG